MQKTVLITGGNRGLGLGFVEYFLKQNFQVFAGTRDLKNFPKNFLNNAALIAIELDMEDDRSIKNAVNQVGKKTEHLDFLINNAGVNKDSATGNKPQLVSDIKHIGRKELLKMFNINTISPLILTKFALPLLKKSQVSYVINVSSDRASFKDEYENSNGNYGYRSSKAALNMMTFASTWDLPKNVRTFSVHPGGVKTDMNPYGDISPFESAEKIIPITKHWKDSFNGNFLRFSGEEYPR